MTADRLAISNLVERFAPSRGLFSSTLAQSPNVQSIVVAQIRHKTLFDVVFVHRNHIVIRQFDEAIAGAGPLKHVATKADFDSLITGAKALGPVEFDWDSVDLSAFAEKNSYSRTEPQSFLEDSPPASEPGEFQRTVSDLQDKNTLPPQVLVLTLRRGNRDTLALLFAFHSSAPRLQFIHHQRPLPAQSSEDNREALRLGAHLAIEPAGRAMVVAAREGRFMLYKLKGRTDWFQDQNGIKLEDEDTFQPIAEEKQIRVSGAIHKIDFLRSQDGDLSTVIIVLLTGFNQQQTLLKRWDWDTRLPLGHANAVRQVWQGHPINPQFFQAHLLIPSRMECGFVLVTDGLMCKFSGIYGPGVPTPREIKLPIDKDPDNSHSQHRNVARERSRWTAWAHPAGRRSDHHRQFDNFYLCREDGATRFIESERGSDIVVHNELKLDTANDTAFTVIALTSDHNSEFVVTANGFFTLRPNEDFERQQTFDDWSNVNDFSFVSGGSHTSIAASSAMSFDKLNLLHTAIKARVLVSIPGAIDDAEQRWIMPAGSRSSVYLVCSSSSGTRFRLVSPPNKEQPPDLHRELEEHLDLESKSLQVGSTSSGFMIQVTRSSVRAWTRKGNLQTLDIQGTVDAAALELGTAQIVLFVRNSRGTHLQLCHVELIDRSLTIHSKQLSSAQSLRLDDHIDAVSCLSVKAAGDGSLLAVLSTWHHGVLCIHIGENGAVNAVESVPCDVPCESISIRLHHHDFLITLGLRNGFVRFVRYDYSQDKVVGDTQAPLGTGPVRVIALPDACLALCDGSIVKLERGLGKSQIFQRQVTLSPAQDDKVVGLSPGPSWYSAGGDSTVSIFTSSATLVTSLSQPRTLCKKVNIFGEGNNDYQWSCQITHTLPYDNKLIVVYKYASIIEHSSGISSNGTDGRRQVYQKLAVINPRSTRKHRPSEDRILRDGDKKDKSFTSGEKVHDIFEWNAVVSRSKYRLIVVRTERPPGTDKRPGRLYVYTVNPDGTLFNRSTIRRGGVIHAAGQFNSNSLILYWNNALEVAVLEKKDGGGLYWTSGAFARRNLPGPGRALAVGHSSSGNQLVHVTTKEQVTVFEDGTERKWESGDRHEITQMHLL